MADNKNNLDLLDNFLAEPVQAQPVASNTALLDDFVKDVPVTPQVPAFNPDNGPSLSMPGSSPSVDPMRGPKVEDSTPWYKKILVGSNTPDGGYQSPDDLQHPMAQKVQDYVRSNIDYGIRHNIAGQALLLGAKAAGLDASKPSDPNADPGLLSLGGVISMADPAALGIFKFAGEGTSLALRSAGLTEKPFFMLSKAAAELGAENASHQVYAGVSDYLKTAFAPFAAKAGIGGSAYGGTQELGSEMIKGDPISPSEIIKKAASSGLGAIAFSTALAPFALKVSMGGAVARSMSEAADKVGSIEEASVTSAPKLPTASLQDKVHSAYMGAAEQTDLMIKQHIIDEKDAFPAIQKMMHDNLAEAGVTPAPPKRMGGLLSWVDWLTKSNYMDKMFGTKTSETAYNFVQGANEKAAVATDLQNQFAAPLKVLKSLGASPQDAYHLLSHMEDMPDGSIEFNPSSLEVPGHFRHAWNGPIPDESVLAPLRELRSTITQTMLNNPEYADKAGYVQGYVPLMNKATGEIHTSTSAQNIMDPSFVQSRTEGMFNPNVHEDDLGVVLSSYANKVAKFQAFNKHIPQLAQELSKLQLLGQGEASSNLLAQAMDAMGVRTKPDATRVLGDKMMYDTSKLVQQIGQNDPTGNMGTQIANSLKDIFYSNTALANFPTILKHAIQPEMIGTAEMGLPAVMKGRALALNIAKNPEAMEAWESAFPLLKKAHVTSDMMDMVPQPQQNGTIKWVTKGLSVTGIPGKAALNFLDTAGRKAMFLGGYDQAMTAIKSGGGMEGMQKVMGGLGAGERQIVADAYAKGGDKAAAQIYGSMRALRTMFAFGEANKADVFRNNALAQFIPFYSWGSQEFSRLAGDVVQGNYATAAKRVAYPLAAIYLFKTLTGRDIGGGGVVGAHPVGAIAEPFTGTMNPAIGKAADFAKKGEFGAAANSLGTNLSPWGPVSRSMKRFGDTDGDYISAIANLPKTKE